MGIISLQNFTYARTPQLSCHVQNCIAITALQVGWEQNEISIEFGSWWKNCLLSVSLKTSARFWHIVACTNSTSVCVPAYIMVWASMPKGPQVIGWDIWQLTLEWGSNLINTLRLRQDGRHFPDDIFKWIFLNKNVWISINISLKFVPRGPIHNIPTLVQVMAWRRPGDKPLSEPMMVRLPTHICVTRPQWVKGILENTTHAPSPHVVEIIGTAANLISRKEPIQLFPMVHGWWWCFLSHSLRKHSSCFSVWMGCLFYAESVQYAPCIQAGN